MENIFKGIKEMAFPESFIKEEIRRNNVQRIVIFSILAAIVNLIHVVVFYLNLELPGSLGYKWGIGILLSHFTSMLFFITIGSLFYIWKKKGNIRPKIVDAVFVMVFFFMLMLGCTIVSIDQMVTPAITPYLIFCAVISLIILIPPHVAISLYLVSYVFFFWGISIFQSSPEIILSNRVNGLTAIFLGALLSLILWQNTVTRFKQSHIIKLQQKELEENLTALQFKTEELTNANQSKDKLFSIIAHDLITPFNLITGLSEFLKENVNDYTKEELEKHLTDINKTSFQAQSLLLELLTWARLQTGNLLYNPEPVFLTHICNRVVESLTPISSYKGITVELFVPENLQLFVDKEMAKTILRNLVSNAIKYSFEKGVITIEATYDEHYATITVKDRGTGIAAEKIDQLFSDEPINSIPGTSNENGSGLGLVLCKEFVKKHGGEIGVKNSSDQGSEFSFTLPILAE
jgi:signal transduction histidine kinase